MTTTRRAFSLLLAMGVLSATAGCSAGRDLGEDATDPPASVSTTATPTARATSAEPRQPLPTSMAALGDSMTRAFASCPGAGDCPSNSWSTGNAEAVVSHAQRIGAISGTTPAVHNVAVSGATVSGLSAQASAAVAADVDYVTILIGANDACAPSEAAMTPVGDFADTFRAALAALVEGLPRARVLVVSIPDLARLRHVGKDRDEVVTTWEQYGICQSMLAHPRSEGQDVAARRGRVRARVADYNREMAAACATFPTCRSDGGAVFDYDFSLAMVSPADYWHPSVMGQRALAEVSWKSGYWG